MLDNRTNSKRVGLVAHLEDIVCIDKSKAPLRRLQVVDRLAHVPFSCEDQRLQAIPAIADLDRTRSQQAPQRREKQASPAHQHISPPVSPPPAVCELRE